MITEACRHLQVNPLLKVAAQKSGDDVHLVAVQIEIAGETTEDQDGGKNMTGEPVSRKSTRGSCRKPSVTIRTLDRT